MSRFIELLEGTFANKIQAQSYPTRYAHIRVSHRLIGENRIYGEQAYNYLLERPYRQFVIDVVQEGEEYRLKNYELANALHFAQCRRLDEITDDMLTYREGCDIIMRETGPDSYFGGTSTCNCTVNWNGTETYVQNEVTLTKDEYHVVDKGLHIETHQKIWGSDWGAFKFVRQ
jgi:CpeT protein